MNQNKSGLDGIKMIYIGFIILGCTLCGLYGFSANRYQPYEIPLLMIAGSIAGFSIGLICNGIISRFRK